MGGPVALPKRRQAAHQILPLDAGISFSGTRNRVRSAGLQLDRQDERAIEPLPKARGPGIQSLSVTAVAVNSVWLKHCERKWTEGRQLNVVAGRATLAEGGNASYSEWRTPPLWGLGFTASTAGEESYLHDGRARSLTEAILWHGGEGEKSKMAVSALSEGDKTALLAFLKSL